MAEIIRPLLTGQPFESTEHRLFSMFQPIQETKYKKSDYTAFFLTPPIDYLILDTAFAIDVVIHVINAAASLLKAAYFWTLNQQDSKDLLDKKTERELDAFVSNVMHIISSTVAQTLNLIFSTASLVTRPVVSILEAICEDDAEEEELGYRASF